MLKLLITLSSCLIVAVLLLQLRHQRLDLSYQTNKLHNEIRDSQAKLWNQQLQIAVYTAPNAITKTVGEQKLDMVPESPLPASQAHWIDPMDSPHAE